MLTYNTAIFMCVVCILPSLSESLEGYFLQKYHHSLVLRSDVRFLGAWIRASRQFFEAKISKFAHGGGAEAEWKRSYLSRSEVTLFRGSFCFTRHPIFTNRILSRIKRDTGQSRKHAAKHSSASVSS